MAERVWEQATVDEDGNIEMVGTLTKKDPQGNIIWQVDNVTMSSPNGNLTIGTDGGATRHYITVNSSTVGRGLIIGTNEVTQIAPTVDTIWGIAINRQGGTLTWVDHTKPSSGIFNELIWDPGLGEKRWEFYQEVGNHVLDRSERPWGATGSYTTGLAQFAFNCTDVSWNNEDVSSVITYAHMKNGHLRLGGSSPGDTALVITQAAETGGGTPNAIRLTVGAHTNLQTGTANNDVVFDFTGIKTWDTGNITNPQTDFRILPRTYAAEGASVFSKAYTQHITGEPTAGTNVTITEKGALWAQGRALVSGRFDVDSGSGFYVRSGTADGVIFDQYGTGIWERVGLSGTTTTIREGLKIQFLNQVGFYSATPVAQPAITGALSTVTDAAAKAVLTSIIAALKGTTGVNLATDGTT